MKAKNVLLLIVLMFSACSPKTLATPISTVTQTQTPVPSLTSTGTPTLTATIPPSPTSTRVPPNPKNVSYQVIGGIPQFEVDSYLRGITIMQEYLCTVYQMCEFKPITLLIGNTGRGCGADDTVGGTRIYMHVQDCGLPNPTELQLIGAAAGESATAYTIQQQGCMTNTGYFIVPPLWSEGINAWLREQSLIWAGEVGDTHGLSPEEWAYRQYVRESPFWDTEEILHMDTAQSIHNFKGGLWHWLVVGYIMFDYLDKHPELITVTPESGAPKLLVTRLCKALLETGSLDDAFETVGVDRQDLYSQIAQLMVRECTKADVRCNNGPPGDTMGIGGKVIWDISYPHKDFSNYILNFCPIDTGDCYGGISLMFDGTFFQSLYPGDYLVSLNLDPVNPQLLGWYSTGGLVADNTCASLVHVSDQQIAQIDFAVKEPRPCAPGSVSPFGRPTPSPMGIGGKITWSGSYAHGDFSTYTLSFCPAKGGDCIENVPIQSDGTFFQLLSNGYYLVRLNLSAGEVALGWYSTSGMVIQSSCSSSIRVQENKTTKIDFYVVSPTQCP